MSTPVSTMSKTTPVSDTAGPRITETRQRDRWISSLSAKMAFLVVVFVLVPIFLYLEFLRAYEESQELLLSSVRVEGRAISQSLLPLLETVDNAALPALGRHLAPFASEVTTIKLLLRPVDAGRWKRCVLLCCVVACRHAKQFAGGTRLARAAGRAWAFRRKLPRRKPILVGLSSSDGRRRDRHRGDPAVDAVGLLCGGRLIFRRRIPVGSSRAALLGDTGGTDRGAGLPCDGRRHLFDAVQYQK
jgi:hypothetical protein